MWPVYLKSQFLWRVCWKNWYCVASLSEEPVCMWINLENHSKSLSGELENMLSFNFFKIVFIYIYFCTVSFYGACFCVYFCFEGQVCIASLFD